MKKRRVLRVEQLEARETPDVSLAATAYPLPPVSGRPAVVGSDPVGLADPLPPPAARDPDEASRPSGPSLQALEHVFANVEELDQLLAGTVPTSRKPSASEAGPSAGDGWQFLSNYTRKAIRNEELRYGPLPDTDDVLHQVLVEWREQAGPGSGALANVLNKSR